VSDQWAKPPAAVLQTSVSVGLEPLLLLLLFFKENSVAANQSNGNVVLVKSMAPAMAHAMRTQSSSFGVLSV
jgi:hypothetical protein